MPTIIKDVETICIILIFSFRIKKEKINPNTEEEENITIVFSVPIILKDSMKKNKDKPNPPIPKIK